MVNLNFEAPQRKANDFSHFQVDLPDSDLCIISFKKERGERNYLNRFPYSRRHPKQGLTDREVTSQIDQLFG